jgi:putative membrane protein
MRKIIYPLLGVILMGMIASCQDNKHAKNYNTNTTVVVDEHGTVFIENGLEAGLAEINASKLAVTNSKNPRIINFAKMMITDHIKAADELEKIGISKRVTEGDTVSAVHKKMIKDLSSKLGLIFDGAYMQMMVSDHQYAIKLFTDAAQSKSEDIQRFAKKTLPTLKMHLDSAKAIAASLK